jgi:hypothetical protein
VLARGIGGDVILAGERLLDDPPKRMAFLLL